MEGWDSMEGDLLVCIVPGITVTERDTAVIGSHGGPTSLTHTWEGDPQVGSVPHTHLNWMAPQNQQCEVTTHQHSVLSPLPPKTFQTCPSLRSIRLSTSLRLR